MGHGKIIARIAAWAIENPGQKVNVGDVFPAYLKKLRQSYFEEHRKRVAEVVLHALTVLGDGAQQLEKADREAGERMIEELVAHYGYCSECAGDALGHLVAARFGD